MKSLKIFSSLSIAAFMLLWCDNDENPYLAGNDSSARIVSKSFNDGDTVSIFSTESLTIALNLKEYVDRVLLRTKANRFWSGFDTVIPATGFNSEPRTFRFSFYDTGWQEIFIITHRTSGDSSEEKLKIYTWSPLHQENINAHVGDTILLSTPPVSDNALYVWDFRDGTMIKNNGGHASYIVKTPLTTGIGEIYVSDHSRRSPSAYFTIVDEGAGELRIVPLNDSLDVDTVFTGDSIFSFRIGVTGAASILTATINGIPFEKVHLDSSGMFVFSKNIPGPDIGDSPMQVKVVIADETGFTLEHIFQIKYTLAVPRSDRPLLHVIFPSRDSMTANTSSFTVHGYLGNRTGSDFLTVFFQEGDSLHSDSRHVGIDSTWQWTFDLEPGWNPISLMAFGDTSRRGDTLALVRRAIRYAPDERDTIKPELVSLLGNGAPLADGQITTNPDLLVKAGIFDNSGLVSVVINGMIVAAETSGVWYGAQVTIEHRIGGTPIHITVFDTAGNKLDTLVTVNLNRPPVFTRMPSTIGIPAELLFSTSIGVFDPDGDSVSLTAIVRRTAGDSAFMLDAGGLLTWRPLPEDTGWHTIKVRAWDGFESAETSIVAYVTPKFMNYIPVQFLTKSTDLPDSLVATEDTLRLVLGINPLSGTLPVWFSARVVGGPVLLEKSVNPLVLWAPAANDTGMRRIELIAGDSLGFTDTIAALVAVVSARPISVLFEKIGSSGPESVSSQAIRVRLAESARKKITVGYAVDWTKTTGDSTDFILPTARTLIFNPGDTVGTIEMSIVNDSLIESDEKIMLSLIEINSGTILGADSTYVYTIIDNDAPAVVRVYFSTIVSSGSESAPAVTSVRLSAPSTVVISVAYAIDTVLSTILPADYQLPDDRTVTFHSGDTVKTLTTTIVNDTIAEPDERLVFRLTSPSAYALLGDQTVHTHNIVNDDFTLQVTVAPAGAGTVAQTAHGAASNGPYQAGTEVELTAKPAAGYRIVSWNGPVMATVDVALVKIRMDSSANVVAVFNVTSPVITVQPVNQNVIEGQSTFFSITATGLNLNYQWQRNGTAINGATGTTYATPALTLSDNGVRYRCIVGNPGGSSTSREAVIVVSAAIPVISRQPHDTIINEGKTAVFRIVATGSGLNYQWEKNGRAISGATSPNYTTPSVTVTDSGAVYRCVVTNTAGSVISTGAVMSVRLVAPSITMQPSNQSVAEGGTVSFSLTASGSRLNYQWQKNGIVITGATAPLYTTPATVFTDSGSVFRCIVLNSAGSVSSNPAVLNVALAPPVVVSNPSDKTVNETQSVTFTAAIRGSNVAYQWRKNGAPITGATSNSYTVASTAMADSGSIFLLVAVNRAGTVTTAGAMLHVRRIPPAITTQPASRQIVEGEIATFSITASGSDLEYQWTGNAGQISGATNTSYTTPAVTIADSNTRFQCIVMNPAGSVTSDAATLTVRRAVPVVTVDPSGITVVEGQPASFSIIASGTGLSYRWLRNGTDVAGATDAAYLISATVAEDNGARFRCTAWNNSGADTSAEALLTVLPVPVLPAIAGPVSVTAAANASVTFTVTATGGTPPITYQWQKNGADLAGETAAEHSIASVQLSQSGETYRCVVTNPAGTVTSASAILTVQ